MNSHFPYTTKHRERDRLIVLPLATTLLIFIVSHIKRCMMTNAQQTDSLMFEKQL